MECAKTEIELSATEGDGASLRTHLQRHAVNTGKLDPRLLVEWPAAGRALWWAFNTMSRTYTMGGAGPIPTSEIEAWQRVYDVHLTSWELDVIRGFDMIVLEAQRDKQQKKEK